MPHYLKIKMQCVLLKNVLGRLGIVDISSELEECLVVSSTVENSNIF